eukprot:2765078-Alexandrium_andersonii.AAC.1
MCRLLARIEAHLVCRSPLVKTVLTGANVRKSLIVTALSLQDTIAIQVVGVHDFGEPCCSNSMPGVREEHVPKKWAEN